MWITLISLRGKITAVEVKVDGSRGERSTVLVQNIWNHLLISFSVRISKDNFVHSCLHKKWKVRCFKFAFYSYSCWWNVKGSFLLCLHRLHRASCREAHRGQLLWPLGCFLVLKGSRSVVELFVWNWFVWTECLFSATKSLLFGALLFQSKLL